MEPTEREIEGRECVRQHHGIARDANGTVKRNRHNAIRAIWIGKSSYREPSRKCRDSASAAFRRGQHINWCRIGEDGEPNGNRKRNERHLEHARYRTITS